ncbi:hypothetical protein [Ramlibacter sp. AN1133]|uniref:hypothetical protein n=1 Tax=Ramlibacter sp. AN1133 TaxID=3133429 RepID=UPI0030BD105D
MDDLVMACRESLAAIEALLRERPGMAGKLAGSTTLGNLRVELKATIDKHSSPPRPYGWVRISGPGPDGSPLFVLGEAVAGAWSATYMALYDRAPQGADDALLRQALEALEAEMNEAWQCHSYHPRIGKVLDALRARFAAGSPATTAYLEPARPPADTRGPSTSAEAVLLDLLAQVRKFCAEQGEAEFETGAAEALRRQVMGLPVEEGLQRQLDRVVAAHRVAASDKGQEHVRA